MLIHWTKINQIIDENSEIKTFLLDCPEGFTWQEGSHTHFAMKGFNDGETPNRSLVRHMSISTVPNEHQIGITTRIQEPCSEYKRILKNIEIGSEVALFGTSTNVPLKRMDKPIYLLSSGVGIATFRPLILSYLENNEQIPKIHSLNIESTKDYLFPEVFQSSATKNFIAQFVDTRASYYRELQTLAGDKDGLYYIIGSDEFLRQTIELLRKAGIQTNQIVLDKHPQQLADFLTF